MPDVLLAMYQAEGGLVDYDIKKADDNSAAYGSALFLYESNGEQETRSSVDYLIDIGNDHCCWFSSSNKAVVDDMIAHARITTPWD